LKQVLALAQMTALCLCLCACSGGASEAELAQEIRIRFLSAENVTLTADLTADYETAVFACKLEYACRGAEGTVSVLAPDTVAGLEAQIADGTLQLRYDGAAWDAGRLNADGLSPVTALPLALREWRDGFISDRYRESWNGTDAVVLVTETADDTALRTWFDAGTLQPIRGEYYRNGILVLGMDFTAVSLS